MQQFSVKVDRNEISWAIKPRVYPMEVVYQAAFVFIDRAYIMLDKDEAGDILVRLKGKEPLDKAALDALQGEFANELLNQAVRRSISRQNQRIRELIVAKALFAAARPGELDEIIQQAGAQEREQAEKVRPWDQATQEEQDELDRLLAEIEQDFADDPMGIAVPWDEKYGEDGKTKDKADPAGENEDQAADQADQADDKNDRSDDEA